MENKDQQSCCPITSFFKNLANKIDKKMKEKADGSSCCCCGGTATKKEEKGK